MFRDLSYINFYHTLRISNKYGSVELPWNNDPTQQLRLGRRGFQSSLAHHWSELFLEIRLQFHTSILLSNWILTNHQTLIWNLGSDAYFEYMSCYVKEVTLFVRNLFRIRLPYLLLIRRSYTELPKHAKYRHVPKMTQLTLYCNFLLLTFWLSHLYRRETILSAQPHDNLWVTNFNGGKDTFIVYDDAVESWK
jgi:hypothetical protein